MPNSPSSNGDAAVTPVPTARPEHAIFCREYLTNGFNASAAYRAAYPGANAKTAGNNGPALLKREDIQAYLSEIVKGMCRELELEAKDVLRLIWETATADANELVEVRRVCCRYCHGNGHRYQFTPVEWEAETARWKSAFEAWERDGYQGEAPILDDMGGVGFHRTKPPAEDCPECFGEGTPHIFVKNTRDLSPAAKRLYAGAKRTREGLEILTHSRDKNLELLGKYFGLFTDKIDHRSGDGSMSPYPPMTLDEFYGIPSDAES